MTNFGLEEAINARLFAADDHLPQVDPKILLQMVFAAIRLWQGGHGFGSVSCRMPQRVLVHGEGAIAKRPGQEDEINEVTAMSPPVPSTELVGFATSFRLWCVRRQEAVVGPPRWFCESIRGSAPYGNAGARMRMALMRILGRA